MRNPVSAWLGRRRARANMAVFGCLLRGDIYFIDIWDRIGGGSGGVILALDRLSRQGLVWSAFVEQPSGPPRRRYGLTARALRGVELHRSSQESLGALGTEDRALIEREERTRGLYRSINESLARLAEEATRG
jgi:Predicted transcriptional regulators